MDYRRCSGLVVQVRAGDDFIVFQDLKTDSLFKKRRFRLLGVDTPDTYQAPPESEAMIVRRRVEELVLFQDVILHVYAEKRASAMAEVLVTRNGGIFSVNEWLRSLGYIYRG